MIIVPGVNGLGITKGVESAYKKIFSNCDYEKINLNKNDIEEQLKILELETKKYFNRKRECFFGGDHSISYPLVKNFFNKFSDGKLIIFDAHPDLMMPMKEPTHEEWLRAVIENGIDFSQILIVGVRSQSQNVDYTEIKYAQKNRIKIIFSKEFDSKIDEIKNFISSGKIYCSFDIDVFDSSIVSSTGYPEKDGLNEKQVFGLLDEIKDKINFFDLVEINFEKGNESSRKKTESITRKILKTLDFD